jgi:polysaccharide pyruvyl transferase CsaB
VCRRVLIQGAYGNGNAGDDAILLSILSDLKHLMPDSEITVLSINPSLTADLTGEKVLYGRLRNFKYFWINIVAVLQSDLYIFGGGGILSGALPYLLAGLLLRAFIAKVAAKRAMIYAVGSDPITRWHNRLMMRAVAALVDVITVRDEMSKHYLEQAGVVSTKVLVTADPAFSLSPASPERVKAILAAEGYTPDGRPLVGFALTHSLSPAMQDVLAQAADHLIQTRGWQIAFLPFERKNDLPFVKAVAHRMRERAVIMRGRYSPAELKGLVSGLDMLVGMRLHSLEFAADGDVPLLAVSFVPKTASFMQRLGQGEKVLYCDWMAQQKGRDDFGLDELLLKIDEVWRERDQIRRDIAATMPDLRNRAKQTARLASSLVQADYVDDWHKIHPSLSDDA